MQVSVFLEEIQQNWLISAMEEISRLCLRPLVEKKLSLDSYVWKNSMAKIRV
jgi:hypothetical protein